MPVGSGDLVERDFDAVRRLLWGPVTQRARVAADLQDRGRFDPDCTVVALLLVPPPDAHGRRDAVEQCLVAVRRACRPHRALHLMHGDRGILLLGLDAAGEAATRETGQHAQRLVVAASRRLGGDGRQSLVGVGAVQSRLARVADSYVQAGHAVKVAQVANEHAPIAAWERLGVFRLLVDLPERDLDTFAPRALRDLDDADDGTLRRTLECYLDHAGHAQATATALSLHRATLHYRLDRIRQVTGVDLRDGVQRLELHLWLKLLRLRGRSAAPVAAHGDPWDRPAVSAFDGGASAVWA